MEADEYEYGNTVFQDVAYDQTLTAFYNHPYGCSRFDIVERGRVEVILGEQGLAGSTYVDRNTNPRLGEMLGAQYLLFVDLSNASADYVSNSGSSFEGVRLGGSGYLTNLQVTLTMVDTATDQIVARSTDQSNEFFGEAIPLQGMYASLGDEEGAILQALPKAISDALNNLFISLNT